jgi:putative membrane protein
MMWGQYDQFSWWWFVIMPLGMLAFWGLVAWLVVAIMRGNRPAPMPLSGAERILAERYARGEIDADEYHRRLDDLHTTDATGGSGS